MMMGLFVIAGKPLLAMRPDDLHTRFVIGSPSTVLRRVLSEVAGCRPIGSSALARVKTGLSLLAVDRLVVGVSSAVAQAGLSVDQI